MKAVAPHARFGHRARQGEQLRDIWLVAVKRGVEARDLRQVRKPLSEDADRRQVVGLMKGRQRHELLKLSSTAWSISTGAENETPPWTTLWPTASRR